jgi:hypothetical protein
MASVWYQQVEEALISLIQSTIILDGSPVKAIVRYPETEFTSADYPCVAISNIGTTFDNKDGMIIGQKVTLILSITPLSYSPLPFPTIWTIKLICGLKALVRLMICRECG